MFQYIICYSLSVYLYNTQESRGCFNTSHVTLYPSSSSGTSDALKFQYITCYSLSLCCFFLCILLQVSIHHMLLFISNGYGILWRSQPVSIHHMLLFIRILTQTVTFQVTFQYITCYSLSGRGHNILKAIAKFQYITCYSLSNSCFCVSTEKECFNTSHVTLYRTRRTRTTTSSDQFQYITCYSLSKKKWF